MATADYADPALDHLQAPAHDAVEWRTSWPTRIIEYLVVTYFSCHGVLDARGRLYFAATDTVKGQHS